VVPGETAAPETPSGQTGVPRPQTMGVPFSITVKACDDTWTPVTTVTHSIQVWSSDASATLPPVAQLVNGAGSFTMTFNASGSFNAFAHDQTDPTIPHRTSPPVPAPLLQGLLFPPIN